MNSTLHCNCPHCNNQADYIELHDEWYDGATHIVQNFYECDNCGIGFEVQFTYLIAEAHVTDEWSL